MFDRMSYDGEVSHEDLLNNKEIVDEISRTCPRLVESFRARSREIDADLSNTISWEELRVFVKAIHTEVRPSRIPAPSSPLIPLIPLMC